MAEYKLGEIETIFADIGSKILLHQFPQLDGTGGGTPELETNHDIHDSETAL